MSQTSDTPILLGRCHCGVVEAALRPGRPVDTIAVRACQCSFCRRHGAATATDASGLLNLRSRRPLLRYRFGLGETDILLCPTCGVYVGGMIAVESRRLATINVAGLCLALLKDRTAEPVDYDGEDPALRRARRLRLWTPVILEQGERP